MARNSDAALTRATIVYSAAERFGKKGFNDTPIGALLQGSGATKGAFYFHFTSKEDIAVAVVDAMHARWAPALQRWAHSDLDALQVMLGLLDELIVRTTTDVVVRAGMKLTVDRELDEVELLAPFPEWERLFNHLLHRAEHTGLLRADTRIPTAAHLLVYGLVGELFATRYTTSTEELRERVDQVVTTLMPVFATPEWVERWERSDWSTREMPPPAVNGAVPEAPRPPLR